MLLFHSLKLLFIILNSFNFLLLCFKVLYDVIIEFEEVMSDVVHFFAMVFFTISVFGFQKVKICVVGFQRTEACVCLIEISNTQSLKNFANLIKPFFNFIIVIKRFINCLIEMDSILSKIFSFVLFQELTNFLFGLVKLSFSQVFINSVHQCFHLPFNIPRVVVLVLSCLYFFV